MINVKEYEEKLSALNPTDHELMDTIGFTRKTLKDYLEQYGYYEMLLFALYWSYKNRGQNKNAEALIPLIEEECGYPVFHTKPDIGVIR